MPMNEQEIYEKVKDVLIEALDLDDDEVGPDKTLREDLGAESIDFLDIIFRLGKAFDITIPRGELFPDNVLNNPEYVQNGKLTDTGLAKLKESMPHADFSEFEKDPDINKMSDVFTVQTIVNYVKGKIGA